jgi:predicted TIM-barrel fold metal-dependent hydrolase
MDAIWQAFLSITTGFSQGERDKLFAENAIKHYRQRI